MFGGKVDKAVFALESIKAQLSSLKAADPTNPGLKSAETRFSKLVKDLERRTGKDLGGGSLTAAGASSPSALPSKPATPPMTGGETPSPPAPAEKEAVKAAGAIPTAAAAKLPYDARSPLRQANQHITRIDGYVQRLLDPNSSFNKKQLMENIDKSLEAAGESLREARTLAAAKGVATHPDIEKAEADLGDAEKRVADARKRYQEALAAASAASSEIDADVGALAEMYRRAEPLFSKATGYVTHYNDLEPAETLLGSIEAFEKNDLGTIETAVEAFAEKYGADRQTIDEKAQRMGYTGQGRASFPYTALSEGIANVRKTRTVMADDLVRRAADMKELTTRGMGDFARTRQYRRVKSWGQLAQRFDPENSRVREFNSGLDAWIAEDLKALNAKIDTVTWPGHGEGAPSDAPKLAKIAVTFLQQEENKRRGAAAGGRQGAGRGRQGALAHFQEKPAGRADPVQPSHFVRRGL